MPLLRDRIRGRTPIGEHAGASGAALERALLDDGTRVVLKTFDPVQDLTMRVRGRQVPLDVDLWRAGVLERLPPELSHPVLDAWEEHGTWVVAMKDLGAQLLDYDSVISRDECRRVLAAAVAMHDTFAGEQVDDVWTLAQRLGVFGPGVMEPLRDSGNPLPGWVLDGWQRFAAVVPSDVVELVRAVHDQPEVLSAPLSERGGQTLLHGDYWLANIAVDGEQVVVIDWGLATAGPPVVEFTSFLAGCAGQVLASREEILDDLRQLWGPRHDEDLLRLGLAFGVVEMGWNLALAAEEHPEKQEALDWWVRAARDAVDAGLVVPP